MRMLMMVDIPHEPFNEYVRNGTVGDKIERIMEAIRPEAVYFSERHGQRFGIFVVDVEDASRVPSLAEPFFLTFDADVELRVCMTPEDMERAGLDALGERWG